MSFGVSLILSRPSLLVPKESCLRKFPKGKEISIIKFEESDSVFRGVIDHGRIERVEEGSKEEGRDWNTDQSPNTVQKNKEGVEIQNTYDNGKESRDK